MTIIKAALQGDRRIRPPKLKFKTLTREEVLALKSGEHVFCRLNSGRIGWIKINGRVRTWKRDPDRVEVPIKYGMYEYGTYDLEEAMSRFVRAEP